MRPGDDDLVRVRDEGELAPNMWVWVFPCLRCGRKETLLLKRLLHNLLDEDYGDLGPAWETVPPSCDALHSDFNHAIADGRLYRLRDLDDSTPATTTRQRVREREHG